MAKSLNSSYTHSIDTHEISIMQKSLARPKHARILKTLMIVSCVLLILTNTALATQTLSKEDEQQLIERTVKRINNDFNNMKVEVFTWPKDSLNKLGNIKPSAFVAVHKNSKGGKRPLIVSLHGGGGKKSSIVDQLIRSARVKGLALAEKSNQDFIMFEPNSSDSWDPVTLNYALSLFLRRYPNVDTNRIYLIGHSMGGSGALAWALNDPDLFAAVSPTGFRLKAPLKSVHVLAKLPIWLAVGSEDGVRPDDVMSVYSALKKAGNKHVGFTAFPGANHSQANAAVFHSTDIVEWFLTQSKKQQIGRQNIEPTNLSSSP